MAEYKKVYTADAAPRKYQPHHPAIPRNQPQLMAPYSRRTIRTAFPLQSLLSHSNSPFFPQSQAITTSTAIYCSGQIPCTSAGEILTLSTSSIAEMTELCIKNLSAVLVAAGSSIEKVVKVTVFLTSMDSFAEMNGVYEKFFAHKPARSCVAVYQLPKGVPVEIECIALP